MLTATQLRELLIYNRKTGEFTWVKRRQGVTIGPAGRIRSDGYLIISVLGTEYYGHRLAWLYVKGEWPLEELDHRNRIRSDNRWKNLRPATTAQNNLNQGIRKDCKSGYRGVCWNPRSKKWRATISANKKQIHLGLFENVLDAAKAYQAAARKLHGEFKSE